MVVTQMAILTVFVALSVLLVIGYAHEDKVINFEDKLVLKIKKALHRWNGNRAKAKTQDYYNIKKSNCQNIAYDQDRPWAEAINYFNNGGNANDSEIISR